MEEQKLVRVEIQYAQWTKGMEWTGIIEFLAPGPLTDSEAANVAVEHLFFGGWCYDSRNDHYRFRVAGGDWVDL